MADIILQNKNMRLKFDRKQGAIYSLHSRQNEKKVEFLLNKKNFPEMDTERARWLGRLALSAISEGEEIQYWTGELQDYKVTARDSWIEVHYCGWELWEALEIAEQYEMSEEGLRWKIKVRNTGGKSVILNRLQIPLPMNQYFCKDDEYKYEQCVLRHSCLCGENAWIYWQRSCGEGPVLVMKAMNHTALDYFEIDEEKPYGKVCEMGRAFEGVYSVFPYYSQSPFSGGRTYTCRLESGDETELEFLFAVIPDIRDLKQWLSGQGGFFAEALPGAVLPKGKTAELRIFCKSLFSVEPECRDDFCGSISQEKDYFKVPLCLNGYGRRKITIHLGEYRSDLELFGIESPEEIYQKQADFITVNQFETEEKDPCYHGLLMWDMTAKHRVNSSCNPNGPDWYAGGSDEIGLVSGLFLSEKNKYDPDEAQIKVLSRYCEDFLEQRLTEMPGYKVHRMVPWFTMFDDWKGRGADDIWRAFNYIHVINTYFNMYRIAALYGFSFLKEPSHYLKQAYQYAEAMFSYWMFPNGVGATEYGNMGEHVLALEMVPALRKENLHKEADTIETFVRKKALFFAGKKYPYGSEMAYDSTAYEAVYAYGKAIRDNRVMESTVRVAMANRGKQPVWYLNHTDLRQMGESSWNVSYMTQLGAWTFYDWALEQKHYDLDLLRGWYASYLAGFSIYNSGGYWSSEKENQGASAWIINGRYGITSGNINGEPILKGAVAMSGESALGYYGALKIAASVVMEEQEGEEICFGCEKRESPDTYYPTDGLRMRFFNIRDGWAMKLHRDGIHKVVCGKDEIEVWLENRTEDEHDLFFEFRTERPGNYRFLCGNEEKLMKMTENWSSVKIQTNSDILTIERMFLCASLE